MIYKLKKTSQFKASLKLAKKRGLNIALLESVIERLRQDKPLEKKRFDNFYASSIDTVKDCLGHSGFTFFEYDLNNKEENEIY